jgi:DNA mismatch endonuclease, patch repair protein
MPDTLSPEKRSDTMRRVKGRDTSLEMKVRRALHRKGLRYRLAYPLPGRPDIVFVRARVAIFLDSCFWHGCPQHLRMPHSNEEYWHAKIARNVQRDKRTNATYEDSEWRLIRLWEHELKENFEFCMDAIEAAVRQS